MGMAAGQARLLSITSRMSDNELRAQIINNQKMRLATQSSQVSEAYVTALNDAQLMFTNYDSENNATYQNLTFNALTAFNPYNNQYSLSNASGQILVSELDATNYQKANGDLNAFLESYGLKYTTTYFDNLNEYANTDGTIPYSTGTTDENGNLITANTGFTSDMLQQFYEGIEGSSLHPGYDTAIASQKYYDFTSAMSNFNEAYTAWSGTIANSMDNTLDELMVGGTKFKDLKGKIDTAADTATLSNILNDMQNFISTGGVYRQYATSSDENTKYFSQLISQLEAARTGKATYTNNDGYTALQFSGDSYNGTITFGSSVDGSTIAEEDRTWAIEKSTPWIWDDAEKTTGHYGTPTYKLYAYDDASETWVEKTGANINFSGNTINISYQYTDDDGASQTAKFEGIPNAFNGTSTNSYSIIETQPVDVESMKETALDVYESLEDAIYNVWDASNTQFSGKNENGGAGTLEYNNYIEAAKALINAAMPGGATPPITEAEYPNLFDTDFLLNHMTAADKNAFQPVLDVLILDNVMNTYGEPKYAWIDSSNVTDSYNENGDSKAQWYTNLWNRMGGGTKNNYQVLQDGLASSTEWIEFALESGLVTLEQVDASYNWNTVVYSSCSDITEQTDDKAVAIAEAEYNAAMNKIENKDKMYDLELKNIDTEHNSLETEYESIKTAIDKNIERTFKIYS